MSKHELFRTLEGYAHAYLEEAGAEGGRVDFEELARAYGVTLVKTSGVVPGFRSGDIIGYDETIAEERQRYTLAHEFGHHCLDRYGYENPRDEWAASFVGAAILLPERAFKRALRDLRWDLSRVREVFGCSWEAAARRVIDVKSAILTIVDNGQVTTRTQSTWIGSPHAERPMQVFEVELAREAMRTRDHAWRTDLCRCWYVEGSGGWQRCLLVIGLEEYEEAALGEAWREPVEEPDVIDEEPSEAPWEPA